MIRMMRSFRTVLVLFILAQGLGACAVREAATTAPPASGAVTDLPPPVHGSDIALDEALSKRRSVREYSDQALTPAEIGQLLWAVQGITSDSGFRTAPSAGALYPLEVYLVTSGGVFHYEPHYHQLRHTGEQDARPAIYQAALQQEPVLRAPAVFVIAAVYARTVQKYGEERSPRYVHMEAGHAAQNLLLEATALGLGAVPVGAFHDEQVQGALGLPADHQPLYLIPVGHPKNQDQ